jgi:hypothetical protein
MGRSHGHHRALLVTVTGLVSRPPLGRSQWPLTRSYLARTWLLDEAVNAAASTKGKSGGSKEQWNGQDWYVSFGEEDGNRSWDDAREYGFVSAGGGKWFSRTLKNLPVGGRVFVCIPKGGYVGVGTVTGMAAHPPMRLPSRWTGPRSPSEN